MSERADPSDWSIRRAGPEDRDALLALLRRSFGADAPSERWWNWAFLENPTGADMHYLVAEAEDRMVGQWAGVPVRLQHGGERILGLIGLNSATDPDFRGRGVLTSLYLRRGEESGADAGVLFGFPNRAALPIAGRTGSVELRPYPLLIRPVADLAREAARQRRWALPAGAAGQLAFNTLASAHGVLAKLGNAGARRIEEFESFGPWADRLWEELSPQLGTCAIRDAAYLNWRFVAAPQDHRRLALSGPRGPQGFVVTGATGTRERSVVVLLELMARPGDHRAARLLIDRVVREARAERAAGIVALVTRRHPFRRELMQAGFLPAPWIARKLAFTVRIFGRGRDVVPNELFHIDDWYLSAGDELETV